MSRSRDFYIKHLGLKVIRDGGEDNCFLGSGDDFFLTLFKGEHPGLNHYCYAIKGYDAEKAEEKLKAAGLKPRREGNRIYFPDPDGIEVQVAGQVTSVRLRKRKPPVTTALATKKGRLDRIVS